jgi:hypothetical protein
MLSILITLYILAHHLMQIGDVFIIIILDDDVDTRSEHSGFQHTESLWDSERRKTNKSDQLLQGVVQQ